MNLNRVVLIGRLTKDPESKQTQDGTTKTKFTLAVDRGGDSDNTDFLPITIFGGGAEACAQYLGKGSLVAVDGKVQVYNYEDDNGQNRTYTYVNANQVKFLDPKDSSGGQQQEPDEQVPF